jgi:hypothetical protein
VKIRIIELMKILPSPITTLAVHEAWNDKYKKHGKTTNQIAQVLARTKQIEKVGFINVTDNQFRTRCCLWQLKD